jgi:hypothetical protein
VWEALAVVGSLCRRSTVLLNALSAKQAEAVKGEKEREMRTTSTLNLDNYHD